MVRVKFVMHAALDRLRFGTCAQSMTRTKEQPYKLLITKLIMEFIPEFKCRETIN